MVREIWKNRELSGTFIIPEMCQGKVRDFNSLSGFFTSFNIFFLLFRLHPGSQCANFLSLLKIDLSRGVFSNLYFHFPSK